jgi:hypothetical protein
MRENDMELDLRNDYFRVFTNLNGKKTSMKGGMNNLTIIADENSEYLMRFEKNDKEDTILMILEVGGGKWGMSNLGAYVPDMLQRLNGMQIIVEFDDVSISIKHDETEKVPELNYNTEGNSCRVSPEFAKEVCKIGQDGCCIFLTASGGGFECEKFDDYMSRMLLGRHAEGTMRANRIGNCKIVGRVEE